MKPRPAHFLGRMDGMRVHRFHVIATVSNLRGTVTVLDTEVVSNSPREALWAVRDDAVRASGMNPVEIVTAGPKGGRVEHFLGWESLIGHGLFNLPRASSKQLALSL